MYITDLTHFLDAKGAIAPMPAPARRLAEFLGQVVAAASAPVVAEDADSGMCRCHKCKKKGAVITESRVDVGLDGFGRAGVRPVRNHAGAGTMGSMNSVHPKKLLLSKWTAVHPVARQKHFIVTKVVAPDETDGPVEWVEVEAVHSGAVQRIRWRQLRDAAIWRQGWR